MNVYLCNFIFYTTYNTHILRLLAKEIPVVHRERRGEGAVRSDDRERQQRQGHQRVVAVP